MTPKQACDKLSLVPFASTPKAWTGRLKTQVSHEQWKQLVVKYSDCLLSMPSDKLVAIGGLARLFAGVMKSDYLAGLWREHLVQDLL